MDPLQHAHSYTAQYYQGEAGSIWHRVPVARRASVFILLFFGSVGELRVVLTKRSSQLRNFPGHISLPGGKADHGLESPWMVGRREMSEEIGLGENNDDLAANHGFVIDHVTELPCYLSRTFSAVKPVVGFVNTSVARALGERALGERALGERALGERFFREEAGNNGPRVEQEIGQEWGKRRGSETGREGTEGQRKQSVEEWEEQPEGVTHGEKEQKRGDLVSRGKHSSSSDRCESLFESSKISKSSDTPKRSDNSGSSETSKSYDTSKSPETWKGSDIHEISTTSRTSDESSVPKASKKSNFNQPTADYAEDLAGLKLKVNPGESSSIFSCPLEDFLYPATEDAPKEALGRTFHRVKWGGIPWNLRSYTFPQVNPNEAPWLQGFDDLSATDNEASENDASENEASESEALDSETSDNEAHEKGESAGADEDQNSGGYHKSTSSESLESGQLNQRNKSGVSTQPSNVTHPSDNTTSSETLRDSGSEAPQKKPVQEPEKQHETSRKRVKRDTSDWGKSGSRRDSVTNEKIYDVWGLTANILHDLAEVVYLPPHLRTHGRQYGEEELIWSVWHHGQQMRSKDRTAQEAALISAGPSDKVSFGDLLPRTEFNRLKRIYKT